VIDPDPDGRFDPVDDHGVLEPGQSGLRPFGRFQPALEEPEDARVSEDVLRDRGPGPERDEQVAALEAFGDVLQEPVDRHDPGPRFLPPEGIEEGSVLGTGPDEIGQQSESAGDFVGRGLGALPLLDLPEGLELIGGFFLAGLQGVEAEPDAVERLSQALRSALQAVDTAPGGIPGVPELLGFPLKGCGPGLVLLEEPAVGLEPDGELFLLAGEELDLFFGPGPFVPGVRQVLEGREVVVPELADARGLAGAGVAGRTKDLLRAGDLGPVRFERPFEPGDLSPGLFELPGQVEDVLEELVAVGLGPLLLVLEEFDPLGFPLDVAIEPGDLRAQRVKPLLAVLEGRFEVPELPASGSQVLLLVADLGGGLVLAGEGGLVESGRFLLGLLEVDELAPVVLGGQLADALPQAPVAVGGLGLALEGVLGLVDLDDDVLEADEVLLGALELVLGLALLVLVVGRAGGLLDEQPLLGRLGGHEAADGPLLDDEVLLLADGVAPELVLDVLEADGLAVHPVFALARAEDPVGDDELLLVVAQGQDDVGHVQGGLLGVAVEDDVVGAVPADGLRPQAADDPEHAVDEVALAGAVGADDGRDAGVEGDLGPVGEGLESLQLELLDDHTAHDISWPLRRFPSTGSNRGPGERGILCDSPRI
jgi:hypothetical protein